MIKYFSLLVISLLSITIANAQSSANTGLSSVGKTLYWDNPVSINPVYTGRHGAFEANFQSTVGNGELGFPTYSVVNANAGFMEEFGIGATIVSEGQGPFNRRAFSIEGSFFLPTERHNESGLGMGVSIQYEQSTLNESALAINPYTDPNDPFLQEGFFDNSGIGLGLGLLYIHHGLDLAIAAPRLLQNNGQVNQNANAFASYKIPASSSIELKPSAYMQIQNGYFDFWDANFGLTYNNVFAINTGYRSSGAANLGFTFYLNLLHISYNARFATGGFQNLGNSMHELLITLNIKSEREVKDLNREINKRNRRR